jgi:outer membrane protease
MLSTSRWVQWPPEKEPSPYAFQVGARYWFSEAWLGFAFANGDPGFGNPTSTLDWHNLAGHSGEVFARLDHKPTGLFVKGMVGGGMVNGGQIEDRDFFEQQIKFSDTTSDVKDGNLVYAMIDIGWAYSPSSDFRIGVFAGYHFWREKVTAFGLTCNDISPLVIGGCPPGSVPIDANTAVGIFQPTWHAVRIGVEIKYSFAERWSVAGEIAAVPYAALQNKDSHLLRADLGPSPNVITDSKYAYGVEAEVFLNYAVTPNIEIGAGFRYWGLTSNSGDVRFGPDFAIPFPLNNFELQRYGYLLQIKGKF